MNSVCVASIVRIYYLSAFSAAIDVTYLMGPVFIWSAIEPSIAIVSACLPHLAPLRHVVRDKLSSMGSKNSGSNPGVPWRSHNSNTGTGSQKGNPMFTYGGSRFNFGNDKMLKLVEADDEIGLTNRIEAGSAQRKGASSASGSDDNVQSHIMVHSTFVQSSGDKDS